MALRALVGKLRVLPERAAASRAFASQLEKKSPKCSSRESFNEMLEASRRRHMEEAARLKRNSAVVMLLGAVGTSALAFYTYCVIEAIFDDDM